VILAGGASLFVLALAYWLVDAAKLRKGTGFFLAVGMNPIFIYVFAQTGGADWFGRLAAPFSNAFLGWAGRTPAALGTALASLALMGGMCFFLYRRKIFIRI